MWQGVSSSADVLMARPFVYFKGPYIDPVEIHCRAERERETGRAREAGGQAIVCQL